MGEFKGTPGPWHHGSHPMNCDIVYAARYEEGVAECNGADEHEAEANARLIAAAPDLLDALRPLAAMYQPDSVEYMGDKHPDHDLIFAVNGKGLRLGDLRRAVQAIAKATRGDKA